MNKIFLVCTKLLELAFIKYVPEDKFVGGLHPTILFSLDIEETLNSSTLFPDIAMNKSSFKTLFESDLISLINKFG